MFTARILRHFPSPHTRRLTLLPFATTIGYLTLDQFQKLQLEYRMRYPHHPLKDSLVTSVSEPRKRGHNELSHRSLVMHELKDSGRISFGNLVHNLDSIDHREKVPPREIGDHLNLFILCRPIGSTGHRAWTRSVRLSRCKNRQLFGADVCRVWREVLITVSEKTAGTRGVYRGHLNFGAGLERKIKWRTCVLEPRSLSPRKLTPQYRLTAAIYAHVYRRRGG